MGQGVSTGHKVLFGFSSSRFFVEDLQDSGLELCHVGNVVGGHTVFTLHTGDDHLVDRGAMVDGVVGQGKVEGDRGGRRGLAAKGSGDGASSQLGGGDRKSVV